MRILGLDGGIASIGWAVVDLNTRQRTDGEIIACGTRMFNSPEGQNSIGKLILKNAKRRDHRGARRVLRRRRQRMEKIRRLFKEHGLLKCAGRKALASDDAGREERQAQALPWELRAQALDRTLEPRELALALGHIAKHRGFKSNRKGERSNNKADDSSKMLSGVDETRERLARYRTIGEMFARDQNYAHRKRNREGDYTRSISRDNLEEEVDKVFEAQRQHGNKFATKELETKFVDIAFFQRPLQSSLDLVGDCPFVEGEKRASAFAPSFEKAQFANRMGSRYVSLQIRGTIG